MFNPTSLFWKFVVPVIALFVLVILALGLYLPAEMQQRAVEGAVSSSQQTAKQYKTLRKYYVQNVVAKVKGGSDMYPSITHKNDPKGFPLPATMIHDLSDMLKDEGTTVNLYSAYPFPNRKSRSLDEFQQEAWDYLEANPQGVFSENVKRGDKSIMRVAIADTMVADACVDCHNSHPDTPKKGWKLGDVRGILEINSDITAQVVATRMTAFKVVVAMIVALGVCMLLIHSVFRKLIVKKLRLLRKSLDELATGGSDLTRRLDVEGDDEIARVATGFNNFLDNHTVFISEIADAASQVADSSASMNDVTRQAQQDSTEQKDQIEMVATAVEEMTASIQVVKENTAQADVSAGAARDATQFGLTVVQENTRVINELSAEISAVADTIQILKADSEGITTVVDVIQGISEQTNLLALNAAIEAARAGEHGRGFAVVADEVRSLASKTQESTVEIQNMIEKLQQGADNAVNVMDKGMVTVESSVQQANEAGENLLSITEAVNEISALNTQIAAAIEEQSLVSEEINKNVVRVNELAQRGDDASTHIADANTKLSDLSVDLSQLVGKYKLE